MLRGIQKASTNWLGKTVLTVVMGMLVVSFAIWGIGDIFRGFGLSTVAKVGSTEIGIEPFRQIYNERLRQLSRQIGRPITPDQARALGLDRQILAQVIADTALDEQARKLRLSLSDEEIARRITNEPMFRGITGQFDRARFLQLIRDNGYTEPRFIQEQRRLVLRQQLVGAIATDATAPQGAVDAFNRFENEQRTVEAVVLDRAQAGDISAPAPEVLAKYFEERKVLFRAPEYRKITLLSLTPAEIAPWIEVSDTDARQAFEERKDRYSTPERREIHQIVFPNEQEARAAAERIAKGTSFAEVASERGLKPSDTNLGLLARSAVIDKAIGDAAFALSDGGTSEPVQGRFGTVLVHVAKVDPGHARSYEEVAEEIKRDLARERALAEIHTRHDKIEDERLAGGTLADIAQRVGMQLRTIEAVDRSGRAPDGSPLADLPQGVDLLTPAFAAEVGTENDALQTPGAGYLWYEVADVTPSRERSLDEVKDRVEERWREDEIASRLRTKASELVEKVKAGTPLAEAVAGVPVQTIGELKRNARSDVLGAKVVDEVFRTPKGGVGTAEGDRGERVVFRVTEIVDPKLDPGSDEAKRISETLSRSIAEDLYAQYVVQLQNDIGTSINQSALNQIVGGGTN